MTTGRTNPDWARSAAAQDWALIRTIVIATKESLMAWVHGRGLEALGELFKADAE